MTYVVTDKCIKCKFGDCVEVCPVNCFYEGENMMVINPEECIDCGVCEAECPVQAIQPDGAPDGDSWAALNSQYAKRWPRLTQWKKPAADANDWADVPHKYPEHFSENPGTGDES